jgi:hypothetical protein
MRVIGGTREIDLRISDVRPDNYRDRIYFDFGNLISKVQYVSGLLAISCTKLFITVDATSTFKYIN